MHYRFRAYSPTLKNFTQRDPIGYVDSGSLYQYVRGNPLSWTDPFGLDVNVDGGGIDEDAFARLDGTVRGRNEIEVCYCTWAAPP
jgi:uncharacterized protein RhaS with RHS repeats